MAYIKATHSCYFVKSRMQEMDSDLTVPTISNAFYYLTHFHKQMSVLGYLFL